MERAGTSEDIRSWGARTGSDGVSGMVYCLAVRSDRRREWAALAALAALALLAAAAAVRARHPSAAPEAAVSGTERTVAGAGQADGAGGSLVAAGLHEQSYTVQAGDTLGVIAGRYETTVAALMEANDLADPDAIFVGQVLRLHIEPAGEGPAVDVVPDSEMVFGPAYLGFDAAAYAARLPGPIAGHAEIVDGETLTGPEILARVARDFSVGPRILVAFLEARGGWASGAVPDDGAGIDYPAGFADPVRAGLWRQLNYLADQLNAGYYDAKTRGRRLLPTRDGTYLAGHPSVGAGSLAVQRALALQATASELPGRLRAFDAAYRSLFGDPWARELPVGGPSFPSLRLPWAPGEQWWLTGGPHGGWADGSAWSAVDFVPSGDALGCAAAPQWATAVADGVVIGGDAGQLWLDLDSDGARETGPVVFYLHLAEEGRAAPGSRVKAGDRLGHPSCEGGFSNATHLHLARLHDGEWLPAAGPDPLTLGGWQSVGAPESYDGGFVHEDGRERTACECREAGYNDLGW